METCIINIILYNFQIKLKIFEIKRKSANYKAHPLQDHPTQYRRGHVSWKSRPTSTKAEPSSKSRIPIPDSRSRKTRNAPLQSYTPSPDYPQITPIYQCSRFCYWFSAGYSSAPFQAHFLENCVKLTTQFSNRMPGVLHIAVFRLHVGENAVLLSELRAGKSENRNGEAEREREREKCRSFAGMPHKIITVQ